MLWNLPIDLIFTSLAGLIGIGLVSLQMSLGNISEQEEMLAQSQEKSQEIKQKRTFLKKRKN